LGEAFIKSLCASFEAKGAQAIRRVREENPTAFLQMVASAARADPEPDRSAFERLSADELDRMLEALTAHRK